MRMFLAEIETPNFRFWGAGHSRAMALNALREALERHAEQTGAGRDYLLDGWPDSANVYPLMHGRGYRNGEELMATRSPSFPPMDHIDIIDRLSRQLIDAERKSILENSGETRTDILKMLDKVNAIRAEAGLAALAATEIERWPGELTDEY